MTTASAIYMGEPYTAAIVTFNRERLLIKCIHSLLHQRHPPKEIFIVDQADSQSVRTHIQSLKNKNKETLFTYVPMTSQNRSMGRNTIIRNAKYRYILFTDDDCVVKRDWGASAMLALKSGHPFVLGQTEMNPQSSGNIAKLEYQLIQLFFSSYQYGQHKPRSYILDTRNCGLDRQTILKHKLKFEPSQNYLEDIDFSYQVYEKNEKIIFEKKMIVYHLFRSDLLTALCVQFELGRGIRTLFRRWEKKTHIRRLNLFAAYKQHATEEMVKKNFFPLYSLFLFVRWIGYCFGTIGR